MIQNASRQSQLSPWEIPLWPEGAPGSEEMTSAEIIEPPNAEHNYLKATNIHNPSLTVFQAPKETAKGAAMIVAPGGGHRFLALDYEGFFVAEYLNSIGIAAFVLKYRLAREDNSPYQVKVHPLADANRAVRLIRSRAGEWGIDPNRVGMMGFSAGANVTAMASSSYDAGNPASPDPIERFSSRPDAQVLIYGGGWDIPEYTADTPPTFILGANDDKLVADTLPRLYLALKKAGAPTELHIYADGGHGFGIQRPPKPFVSATTWQLRLADWLGGQGLLTSG